MMTIFNINEFTLPRFLVSALLGRKPVVLAVDPLFPPFRRLLEPLVNWAVAKGRAHWIIDFCPELDREWEYKTRVKFYNIYAELEPWQDDYYAFADAEAFVPDYSRAYKLTICKQVSNKQLTLLLVKATLSKNPAKIIGLSPDTISALKFYWKNYTEREIKPLVLPHALLNLATTLLISLYSLGWIFSRLRIGGVSPQYFFFAVDYYEDEREFPLYHEVAEGGPLLLVPRNPDLQTVEPYVELKPYQHCGPKEGLFGPRGALSAAAMVFLDSLRLFRLFRKIEPALFYQIISMPYRRAVFRAFFTRFRPKYFWGRDDYNIEHILRTQEIHRIGGKSFGINHGTVIESLVQGEFRYINFDHYYVFGKGVYTPEMQKRWHQDMKVIPVGSFSMTRKDYPLRFQPRPKNIIFCVGFFVGLERCVEMVRTVAKEFPERKILLQVKKIFIDKKSGRNFVSACQKDLPNIKPVRGRPINFFPEVTYSFSDPSTTVLEAIQFGLTSFCMDLSTVQKNGIFREFPDLCLSTGEEAIERIRTIENKQWHYPIEKYGDLVDLSGKVFFDKIREDVGLPAKESAIPLIPDNADRKGLASP